MGFSGLGRGMWGGLWPLSVCQVLVSWMLRVGGQAGSKEDRELPGQAAKLCIPGTCIWGREGLHSSSGFCCVEVQYSSLNSWVCVAGMCFMCVEGKRKDRRDPESPEGSQDPQNWPVIGEQSPPPPTTWAVGLGERLASSEAGETRNLLSSEGN
jgi:hypothetical protein